MKQDEKIKICLLEILTTFEAGRYPVCSKIPACMDSMFHIQKDWSHHQTASFMLSQLRDDGFVEEQNKKFRLTRYGQGYIAGFHAGRGYTP